MIIFSFVIIINYIIVNRNQMSAQTYYSKRDRRQAYYTISRIIKIQMKQIYMNNPLLAHDCKNIEYRIRIKVPFISCGCAYCEDMFIYPKYCFDCKNHRETVITIFINNFIYEHILTELSIIKYCMETKYGIIVNYSDIIEMFVRKGSNKHTYRKYLIGLI